MSQSVPTRRKIRILLTPEARKKLRESSTPHYAPPSQQVDALNDDELKNVFGNQISNKELTDLENDAKTVANSLQEFTSNSTTKIDKIRKYLEYILTACQIVDQYIKEQQSFWRAGIYVGYYNIIQMLTRGEYVMRWNFHDDVYTLSEILDKIKYFVTISKNKTQTLLKSITGNWVSWNSKRITNFTNLIHSLNIVIIIVSQTFKDFDKDFLEKITGGEIGPIEITQIPSAGGNRRTERRSTRKNKSKRAKKQRKSRRSR
jgi:hypothetical protein